MKHKIIGLIMVLFFTMSCSDILDKEPLGTLSDANVWAEPALIESYIAYLYNRFEPLGFSNHIYMGTPTVEGWTGSGGDGQGNRYSYGLFEALSDEAQYARFNRDLGRRWQRGLLNEYGGLMEVWDYASIRTINVFYENFNNQELTNEMLLESDKNELTGLVKFIEAFRYFEMAKRYGAVPIVTKVLDPDPEGPDSDALFPPRNPEVEVYDYAISCLDTILSQELLPDLPSKSGYPSKAVVLALKSRIAQYAASIARFETRTEGLFADGTLGVPDNREMEFWQMSYDAADEIIKLGTHSLYIPGEDISEDLYEALLNPYNPEFIMIREFDGLGPKSGHSWMMALGLTSNVPAYMSLQVQPTLDFVEKFEKIDGSDSKIPVEWIGTNRTAEELFGGYDPRMKASILCEGDLFAGSEVHFYNGLLMPGLDTIYATNSNSTGNTWIETAPGDSAEFPITGLDRRVINENRFYTGFAIRKYVDESVELPVKAHTGANPKVVFRLAEMYLNRAEAAFYLDNNAQALTDVNKIRSRAGMPAREGAVTEEQIRYERMAEFAFEDGYRYWDLIRWRKAMEYVNSPNTKGMELMYIPTEKKYYVTDIFSIEPEGSNAAAPWEKVFFEKHYYKPITLPRINKNPEFAPDNPGYEF